MENRTTYFPFFVNIEGKKGLIVGGNKHAYEKLLRMQPYGVQLTVIAPKHMKEMEQCKDVHFINREFCDEDIERLNPDFVVVAEAEEEQKQSIYGLCMEKKIPINTVDDVPYCSYIYPALIAKGSLSVGICTGGASPAMTAILKEKILELIPDRIDKILDWLEALRPELKEKVPDGKKRGRIFRKLAEEALEQNEILSEDQTKEICAEMK